MKGININIGGLNEYTVNSHLLAIKSVSADPFQLESATARLLTAIDTYGELHSHLSQAICMAAQEIPYRFAAIVRRQSSDNKVICFTKNYPIYISRRNGLYTIIDYPPPTHNLPHDQVIKLDDDVIAEVYAEGSCLFKDKNGHRLNPSYLNTCKKLSSKYHASLLSQGDFDWLLSKSQNTDIARI